MASHRWRFAECEFDELSRELRVRGKLVEVEAKPLDVLQQLLRHDGQVLTKEALLEAVWPGLVVVDGSLATAVSKLRRALGPCQSAIVTLPRVGYRLGVPAFDEPASNEPATAEPPAAPPAKRSALRIATVAGVAAMLALAGWMALRQSPLLEAKPLPAVAVLPLQNLAEDGDQDYLSVALADEVATLLSHSQGLAVRPLATRRDLETVSAALGRELGADAIVTGHYHSGEGRMVIALEAVEASTGKLIWRDTLNTPASSLVAVQVQLALRIREGLVPRLGGSVHGAGRSEPRNEQAYAAYLHSVALASDPEPNREGLDLLRISVALDPDYAPAWFALSRRLYMEARYGGGAARLLAEGAVAAERAHFLDPDNVAAAAGMIVWQVEHGELVDAWQRASRLVQRRPDSVEAHFSLSYALRYAGLLEESGAHCERAMLLDPRNTTTGLRSCAVVFLLRGDEARTVSYLHLDEGSEFERALKTHLLVSKGRVDEAVRVGAAGLPSWGGYRMMLACAAGRPQAGAGPDETELSTPADAETDYFTAAQLAYCGRTEAAAQRLARAISAGYCAYPAMTVDPMLASLRRTQDYPGIESAGRACQAQFLAARSQIQTSGA